MRTILWPILRRALKKPRATAVIDDQRRWRYLDLVGGALHLSRAIKSRSQARNIGILLPTSGAFPMALLAVWMLKRIPVPINYLLSGSERQYIVEDAGLDTVITAGPMLDHLDGPPEGVNLLKVEDLSFQGIPPPRIPPIAAENDPAVILYTSGTSGKPKGVVLTHRNLRSNVEDGARHIGITRADCFLGLLPQFHSYGLTALTLMPLCVGVPVVYTARFVPRRVVELIREHRPDILIAIPSMYNALMTVKKAGPEDFSHVRLAVSGGERLPEAVYTRFKERFGIEIRQGYGLTETSPVVSINTAADRSGSVGRPIARCSIRILDDEGRVLGAGEQGEVAVAGPNIMAGYYRQPELTNEVIDEEGYFHTGDWGMLDEEGFLYITGRKKEMLIIGGENVFPREIEEVINRHPSVNASAVVGKSDPSRGEVPLAFVEMIEGAEFDEAELRNFCREHLAGYKVPREVRRIDELPRTPTGKVLRRGLVVGE